jgi:predicted transcriptional regulator YheO
VAALCVNTDTTRWEVARDLLGSLVEGSQPARDSGDRPKPLGDHEAETFVHNVDELAALLIRNAVRQSGVPVELMKKDHKLQVVQELRARGMFTLRDAIGQVSEALEVSKFTIYNYLNEISEREAATSSKPVPRSRRRRTQ